MKTPLQESIEHWEDNLKRHQNREGMFFGSTNCPLCAKFNKSSGCNGCPIKAKTGMNYCGGTPYKEVVHKYYCYKAHPVPTHRMLLTKAIKKELNFLKSLRTEELLKEKV